MISNWEDTKASDFDMCETFFCEGEEKFDNPSIFERIGNSIKSADQIDNPYLKSWDDLVAYHAERDSEVTIIFGTGRDGTGRGFVALSDTEPQMRKFIDTLEAHMAEVGIYEDESEKPYISHCFDMVC